VTDGRRTDKQTYTSTWLRRAMHYMLSRVMISFLLQSSMCREFSTHGSMVRRLTQVIRNAHDVATNARKYVANATMNARKVRNERNTQRQKRSLRQLRLLRCVRCVRCVRCFGRKPCFSCRRNDAQWRRGLKRRRNRK